MRQICRWVRLEWEALRERDPEGLWRQPLTTGTVARRMGLSRMTVRRWIQSGRLPARRLGQNYQVPRGVLTALDRCRGCVASCVDGRPRRGR